jgi:copper chaperone NosL
MKRRDLLKFSLLAAGAAGISSTAGVSSAVRAEESCPGDGTPAQFIPKGAPDPAPLEGDIEKYPKCPYCGMDRAKYHHSRMLIHYADDLADGTCSLHCAAISLAINVDREPKGIYVADNAVAGEPKPLLEAGSASFLIGSRIKGVMTRRSKVAYGNEAAAQAAQQAEGGELAGFEAALGAAYADMAQDVAMIRKNREERRRKAAERPG